MGLFKRRGGVPTISPNEAAERLARGGLVLRDVREPSELAEMSIAAAVHIPLGDLEARRGELSRERPIAVICRAGSRSASATEALRREDLDASSVQGGIIAWQQAGLPVRQPPQR